MSALSVKLSIWTTLMSDVTNKSREPNIFMFEKLFFYCIYPIQKSDICLVFIHT